ncbi:serine hydrolase domain-containing protein [Nocardia altamirensis]|uniref:serine hydrolase domain-containing protein n=1 Tax=Nocardia altamirensis TaxID=472158 RepID=UPI0008400D89|nr:serine hydrolase domain-containing protein [Nocardia altamirensis]
MTVHALLARVLGVAMMMGMPAIGACAPYPLDDTRLDHPALERALSAMVDNHLPGTYALVRDGEQTWRHAAGVADLDTGRAMQPDFQHRSGSTTKTFAATAVLQLVASGVLDLDTPIAHYLPEVVPGERGRQISVRMLLNHTSGIADHYPILMRDLDTPEAAKRHMLSTPAARDMAALGLGAPPTEQGKFAYSNANYAIIELLLDAMSGQPAREFITRNVIERAGLHNTYFPGAEPQIRGPHAEAYEDLGPGKAPLNVSVQPVSAFSAGVGGGIVSTMDDLARFYRLLLTGALLPPDLVAQMKQTVDASARMGAGSRYGLGLTYQWIDACGQGYWGHNGGVAGMITDAFSTEDGQRQVAVGRNMASHMPGAPKPPWTAASRDFLSIALCGKPGAGR